MRDVLISFLWLECQIMNGMNACSNIYNVTEDMLPKVVHIPGTVVGNVSEEVSKATGLPVTCKVCLGNLDANSCAIGSGADEIGTQLLIMGTAGVSIFVTDKDKLDPNGRITVRTNPGFGNWQNYIMTNTGHLHLDGLGMLSAQWKSQLQSLWGWIHMT